MSVERRRAIVEPAHRHLSISTHSLLLHKLTIKRPNLVWCAVVTFIPMRRGSLYLAAIPAPAFYA